MTEQDAVLLREVNTFTRSVFCFGKPHKLLYKSPWTRLAIKQISGTATPPADRCHGIDTARFLMSCGCWVITIRQEDEDSLAAKMDKLDVISETEDPAYVKELESLLSSSRMVICDTCHDYSYRSGNEPGSCANCSEIDNLSSVMRWANPEECCTACNNTHRADFVHTCGK